MKFTIEIECPEDDSNIQTILCGCDGIAEDLDYEGDQAFHLICKNENGDIFVESQTTEEEVSLWRLSQEEDEES